MSLAGFGEFDLIGRIRAQVGSNAELLLGIGDDCSAATLPAGEVLLTSTDLLIEGVHFRRDWTDLASLGRKCVAVNVSDVAAMGGRARQLYLGLALPPALELTDFDAFVSGVLAACADYGVTLAGGDTCRSLQGLLLAITVQGSVAPELLVRRSGARPGEDIYVSGTLGDSALALRELQAGRQPLPALAARHHRPQARQDLGQRLAATRLATAMIDVSDGLLADLGHILTASGVGATLEAAALPLSAEFAAALAQDARLLELVLAGGEDYELLFTVAPTRAAELVGMAAALDLPLTRIGTIGTANGLQVLAGDGQLLPVQARGFNHFAAPPDR